MNPEDYIKELHIHDDISNWTCIFWKEKCPSCGKIGYWLLDQFHCECFEEQDS